MNWMYYKTFFIISRSCIELMIIICVELNYKWYYMSKKNCPRLVQILGPPSRSVRSTYTVHTCFNWWKARQQDQPTFVLAGSNGGGLTAGCRGREREVVVGRWRRRRGYLVSLKSRGKWRQLKKEEKPEWRKKKTGDDGALVLVLVYIEHVYWFCLSELIVVLRSCLVSISYRTKL